MMACVIETPLIIGFSSILKEPFEDFNFVALYDVRKWLMIANGLICCNSSVDGSVMFTSPMVGEYVHWVVPSYHDDISGEEMANFSPEIIILPFEVAPLPLIVYSAEIDCAALKRSAAELNIASADCANVEIAMVVIIDINNINRFI